MTGTAVLNILLGAALVAIGVLAAALADRIRGIRPARETHETTHRAPRAARAAAIEVVESEPPPAPVIKPAREKAKAQDGAEDVIAALIGAGYKKPIATEAAWACSQAERTTIEDWTRAALRRCARGAAS